MHRVILIHLSLFWVVCYLSRTFPPNEFEWEPHNRLLPSPHSQTTPSLTFGPWPTTPVLVGYKLVVPESCVCSTSMCVYGLFAAHAFAMTWRLICTFCWSFLTSCGMNGSLSLRFFFFFFINVLLPSWAGPYLIVGFYFSNPFFALFVGLLALLPCYSVILAVLLFDSCLLGLFFWAYCMLSLCLILVAKYYHWASDHAILGLLGSFHRFRASLAHFIILGILGPFKFFIPMGLC